MSHVTTRRFGRRAAAGAAALALLLTGCMPASTQGGSDAMAPAIPTGLEQVYSQELSWKDCGGNQCTTVKVPLDYEKPDGETIDLAVVKIKAKGQRKGTLFTNPGGPGASGVNFAEESSTWVLSKKVREAYDVVGFDPRGVGRSTAVACLNDKQLDEEREKAFIPVDDEGLKQVLTESKEFGAACEKNSPKGLLEHVDTMSAAHDLDVLRAVMGENKLDYLGYSYGTKLGQAYLSLFPGNAGRLVLDGALPLSLDGDAVGAGQAKGFEKAVDTYLTKCLGQEGCPFTGDLAAARTQLQDLIEMADQSPLPSDSGRTVPAGDVVSALFLPMYEPTLYPQLDNALGLAMHEDDGTGLLELADTAADRQQDGSYKSNSAAAFPAINCIDYTQSQATPATMKERAAKLEAEAPLLWRFFSYDDGCGGWPVKSKRPAEAPTYSADLAPVLVVGTTGDPATPYAWAQETHQELPQSALLTYRGEGHTAYGRSNACVADTVDAYLLDGTLPEGDAKTC